MAAVPNFYKHARNTSYDRISALPRKPQMAHRSRKTEKRRKGHIELFGYIFFQIKCIFRGSRVQATI